MILASQSPRRIELMREAGYNIRVIPADIDETPFDGEAPLTLVERLARAKAADVFLTGRLINIGLVEPPAPFP